MLEILEGVVPIGALALGVFLCCLTLHPPTISPNPKQQTYSSNNYAANDINDIKGTKGLSVLVDISPSGHVQVKPIKATKQSNPESSHDEITTFTGYLVIVGFLQLFVFGWQARRLRQTVEATNNLSTVTDQLVKDAKDTARNQLRAYVFVSHIEVDDFAKFSKPAFRLKIKNFGQTPPRDTIIKINFEIIGQRINYRAELLSCNTTIPPGHEEPFNFYHHPDQSIPDNWQIEFINKTAILYVDGIITYKDHFRNDRYTKFKFVRNSIFGHPPEMSYAEDGNKWE